MDKLTQIDIDHLYMSIFHQHTRYSYFYRKGKTVPDSVWDKTTDERLILENLIRMYKQYYKNQVQQIKHDIIRETEDNKNAFFTFDTGFYEDECRNNINHINKYLKKLQNARFNDILEYDFSKISEKIDNKFAGILLRPSMLNKFRSL